PASAGAELLEVRPRRRLHQAHLRPVGVELLGEDHRQRRAHPLSHLLLADGEHRLSRRLDPDPRIRAEGVRLVGGEDAAVPADADDERAAGDGADLEEFASSRHASPLRARRPGRAMDRLAHARVAAAAAHLAIDDLVDVGVGRLRLLLEERAGRADHPRLAVAALRDVLLDPGALAAVRAVGREALDGDEALAGRIGERDLARAHRPPVLEDGAGPADADAAAVLGAGEPDLVADH